MAHADLTGHTLGQYTILERLGRGGMADVYKAFHPRLEVNRAIKVIRPEFVEAEDFRLRFQKEAQAVAALRHPNIVQVHDFGEEGDIYYMVMEFIEGLDLKQVVQREEHIRPISRAVSIVRQVADALHYAHARGLIHRDIKPENIMLDNDQLPVLMDFGIAKLLTVNTQLTQTGLSIGTPAYMAPEQAKAEPEIGPPADLYSLTIVLYEMLTGRLPFSADTPMAAMLKALNDPLPLPRQFSPDIGESLQQVLVKGTAKEVKDRYATARQFQAALDRAMEDEPGVSGPAVTEFVSDPALESAADDGPAPKEPRPRRNRTLMGVTALFVLLAAVVGYVLFSSDPTPVDTAQDEDAPPPVVEAPAEEPDTTAAAEKEQEGVAPEPEQSTVTPQPEGSRKLVDERITTSAGQPLDFPVQASAEDVLYLQVHNTSATTDFELLAPDQRTQVLKYHQDFGPVTLGQSGEHRLTVLTRGDKSADVEFTLWLVDPAVVDGGEIEPGVYVQGETTVPGQRVQYGFAGKAGQTVYFDHVQSTETTDFSLLGPDGRTEVFKHHTNKGPLELKRDGAYTLAADPRGDRLSSFDFALWSVDPAVVDGGEIESGVYVQGETTVPGQRVQYRFAGKAGQTVHFDHVQSTETTDFSLLAPDGRTEVFKHHTDKGPLELKRDGTYTLVADPRGDRLSSFEFALKTEP